ARVGEIMRAAARRRDGAGARPAGDTEESAVPTASTPAAPVPSMRALYRELTRLHVARVAHLERELETDGLEDAALLDAVEARLDELTAACERDAAALGKELQPAVDAARSAGQQRESRRKPADREAPA
ncbi:MAG TPA: hypothetical protein VFX49_22095, partial [Chloroflexota bacterium]|nr:hypothetical protein [Chloroflexota bacterium]